MADPAQDVVVSFAYHLPASAVQGQCEPLDPTRPLAWSSEHPRRPKSGRYVWEDDLDRSRDALLLARLREE